MKLSRNVSIYVLIIGLLFLSSGCKTLGSNKVETPIRSKPVVKMTNVVVYYPKMTDSETYLVREVHKLKQASDIPKIAVEELIKGQPVTDGAYKVIPSATKVLGIKIDNQGVATVNFSAEVLHANVGSSGEAMGIASIVNTLTEFPNIKKVSFTVDGQVNKAIDWWGHVGLSEQPFSQDLSVVNEPAIWVTAPASGQIISNPVEIKGSARVFEATVSYRIKDASGKVLAEGFTNASEGAPGRGDFTTKAGFTTSGSGKGQIEVFEVSMKDGSDRNKVIIPVKWN